MNLPKVRPDPGMNHDEMIQFLTHPILDRLHHEEDDGMGHAEMIQLLTQAGYVVRKLNAV